MNELDHCVDDTRTWWAKPRLAARFISNTHCRHEFIAASALINNNVCDTVLIDRHGCAIRAVPLMLLAPNFKAVRRDTEQTQAKRGE
jgi:hypothetical protein